MLAVTSTPRNDGFGAQFQTILCAALYAHAYGCEFVYSRPRLSHLYSEEEVEEFNKLINFEGNFRSAEGTEPTVDIGASYTFVEGNIDAILEGEMMAKIRKIFKENKTNPFEKGTFNVAVHIRRPSTRPTIDVMAQNGGWGETKNIRNFDIDQTDRFSRNSHFLTVIQDIRSKHPGAIFHIFSDGDPELFESFKAPDTVLHISTSIPDTWTRMVFADILVTSKSSFSYTAALLSENTVYYTPFWHKPASKWIKI